MASEPAPNESRADAPGRRHHRPTGGRDLPVLAFDGDCGFCQRTIDTLTARARPRMRAVPWQSLPDAVTGPHVERLDHEVLVFRGATVVCGGADAIAAYVRSAPARRHRAAAALLTLPGVRFCARRVYAWVSANRLRMPGSTAACAVPRRG
ncbi:thiol-disulfide oxidoreductase DCC family protein [Streptomyces sp. NPDC001922]|uniref:thiol-disulfide oxidoreductase DCC family protein n=1 Tax=Streptomyces sp. NPDC001922 TaxID=3364624 RepID=UPI0036BDA7A2